MFLGTARTFDLKEYQQETGKDYQRIVLYLCSVEGSDIVDHMEVPSLLGHVWIEAQPSIKKERVSVHQVDTYGEYAKTFQRKYDNEDGVLFGEQVQIIARNENIKISKSLQDEKFNTIPELINFVSTKIQMDDQFFLVIRKGATLQRNLAIWDGQSKKKSPKMKSMIHYAGEDGIDTGVITKEYLSETISNISGCVFPEGTPIDSMLHVHNGYFRICGEITIVSLVNGGPPPCFFEENVYKMLCDPNSVDLQNLSMKEHLTSKEVEKMTDIENNPTEHREYIIENGYTGFISPSNINDIIGTVLVSIVTKRLTYLKEFYTGLELLGFGLILKSNSELLKPIFVGQVEEVDANFLVASIKATFSELGTNRRNIEEMIIDYLQDTIISLEDEEVAGETEQLAYLQTNDRDCGFGEGESYSDVIDRVKPEMSAAGVLQWLTSTS